MPKSEISQIVFNKVATLMEEAIARGTNSWPLPQPPLKDNDFPVNEPGSSKDLIEQSRGILNSNKGMFEQKLNLVLELIVPHRMNLTDNSHALHQKWLKKRTDMVAERLIFLINHDWLAQALDPGAPDTTRWWLSIALLNGLSNAPTGQPVHQGYHLLESIAIAQQPGTWHTQPQPGPQNIDWNPYVTVPRFAVLTAHKLGSKAATWLLDQLESGSSDRRILLIEWIKLLFARRELIEPLALVEILTRRSVDKDVVVAVKVSQCLNRVIDYSQASGYKLARLLMTRQELPIRRAMADALSGLLSKLGSDALPFFEQLKLDEDKDILAAVSTTSANLKFIDKELWANTLNDFSSHASPIVRRNIVPSLRDYFEYFPDDKRKLLPKLWQDGDEMVRTRMRELLIRMANKSPNKFSERLTDLLATKCELKPLWDLMDARKAGSSLGWLNWSTGKGEIPESVANTLHVSDMQAPESLPNLADALDVLDRETGLFD